VTALANPPPNLLLLSNSRNPAGEYLVDALPALVSFTGKRKQALFFPFAGVTVDWDAYLSMVQKALEPIGFELTGAHQCKDLSHAIAQADLVLVGGGNTFRLLYEMRVRGCLDAIRSAVHAGAHYVGWSAGSVLAGPTIQTTNDMPIIDPLGMGALGLVPFQINAHYNNTLPAGHQGETRNQRLMEYLVVNAGARVLGLPEGNWLEVRGDRQSLGGPHPNVLFLAGHEPRPVTSGSLVWS
jgi:dipeptidase E